MSYIILCQGLWTGWDAGSHYILLCARFNIWLHAMPDSTAGEHKITDTFTTCCTPIQVQWTESLWSSWCWISASITPERLCVLAIKWSELNQQIWDKMQSHYSVHQQLKQHEVLFCWAIICRSAGAHEIVFTSPVYWPRHIYIRQIFVQRKKRLKVQYILIIWIPVCWCLLTCQIMSALLHLSIRFTDSFGAARQKLGVRKHQNKIQIQAFPQSFNKVLKRQIGVSQTTHSSPFSPCWFSERTVAHRFLQRFW